MRCFVHETEARGVCSICGRGVCNECAGEVGNRLVCASAACSAQASTMRRLTVVARPEFVYGVPGLLLLLFGVAAALVAEDWVVLFLAAIGLVFIGMAFAARRSA